MKKFKKMLSILISVCMIMNLSSLTLFAEENSSGNTSDLQIVENGEKIYYLADGTDNANPNNFDVWTSKTIVGTDKEDEFEITLQVGTTMKAVPNDVAVVLVMDVSGSMMNDEDGNRWYENNMPEGHKRRIEYTREAAIHFANAIVENAGSSQRMLSIVQFGNSAMTVMPWTDVNNNGVLLDEAKDSIENIQVNYTIDANMDYWDEVQALIDFGRIDYWDSTEVEGQVVGCTLTGCPTPNEGPHTHSCVHGGNGGIRYFIKYNRWSHSYGYRCKNPDPTHTHEFLDSDLCYLTGSRYFGSVWAIGTNLEGGLLLARNLVNNGLSEGGAIEDIDNVYVILLSDGNPTWMTDETSTTEENLVMKSTNLGAWEAVKDIVITGEEGDIAIAEDIKAVSKLYAVLYGNSLEDKFSGNHPLAGVSGADWIRNSGTNYVGADAVFESPNADSLDTAFLNISDRIDMLAKAWIVTDELGGIELGDDVSFIDFTSNGEYASVVPNTDGENTTISWSLGNMDPESGSGSMEDPYIYTLKYTVKLNSAKDSVKKTTLDYDAEISNEAVWANNSASLQYIMVEKDELDEMTPEEIMTNMRTAMFAKPSVKGIYGDFAFIKKNGVTGDLMEGVGFTVYDSNDEAYGIEVFSDADGKVIFKNIPRGEYTLKETTVPDGMQQMDDITLSVSWGVVTLSDGNPFPEVIKNWAVGVTPTEESTTEGSAESTTEGTEESTIEGTEESTTDGATESTTEGTEESTTEGAEESTTEGSAEDEPEELPSEEDTEIELPDEDVPKGDAPVTGDMSTIWLAIAALSGAVLASVPVYKKRKEA